ncbi:MAG: pirin family protein [Sphaerochaeta sp.]|jgi:redox-sensitive bicupin YhaK (pirin superfamily)|nr:pirin family protein [Sphaerochaeta sp.]MCH3919871.1 pirin family protein [Sphaerochaeta sp.]MCI2076658.1 pirin family protein [Sphaerochaeta sp.]
MERKIINQVRGFRTEDGAGVSLVRVLGGSTVKSYDPILMLDSFDSTNPDDYTAGFPMHPHRGIETISYVYRGKMVHIDSLGNKDAISDGEVQWMTAGSGILHEEQVPAADRLLGVQLWLNLPKKDKMVPPAYHSIKKDAIKEFQIPGGFLRLLAGSYQGEQGHQGKYLPLDYYDIHLQANASLTLKTDHDRSVMVFSLLGNPIVAGEKVREKTAVKLSDGDELTIQSGDEPVQVLFMSSVRLNEPVVWGGPIVMNTREELNEAFDDLNRGTFLRDKMVYDQE